jgi:hypothetical protein
MTGEVAAVDLRERNRRVVRLLLALIATLVIASILVGIRW